MIHTLEIMKSLSSEHINSLLTAFNFTEDNINYLLDSNREHCSISSSVCNGIPTVTVCKWNFNDYRLVFRMNPQTLLTGQSSVDLFIASTNNVCLLQQRFQEVIGVHLHNLDIPNVLELSQLSHYKCRRIDYTFDFHFDDQRDVDTFCNLTKKTSKFIRTTLRRCNTLRKMDQSTAEANKSVKVMFYDKRKQIAQTNRYYSRHVDDLLNQANGILRMEVQCHKSKIESLRKNYGFSSKCIMNYLSENIAADVLLKYYDNSVGCGDFYSLYHAKRIIQQSDLTNLMKDKLGRFLQLIAQARHVSDGKEQFKRGTPIKGNNENTVLGSINTFRSRLKLLQQLNINPVSIPKDWRIQYFRNPIYQLEMYISEIRREQERRGLTQ